MMKIKVTVIGKGKKDLLRKYLEQAFHNDNITSTQDTFETKLRINDQMFDLTFIEINGKNFLPNL